MNGRGVLSARTIGGLLLCCGVLALTASAARGQDAPGVSASDQGAGASDSETGAKRPTRSSQIDRPAYELSLSLSVHAATRDDFSRRVLLLQQLPRRVEARELRYTITLDLDITPALYVRGEAPLSQRHVRVRSLELVVSADEVLPGVNRELSSFGLADPTLAIGYRPLVGDLGLELELGTVIPVDDNPGSNTFPAELPLGTGQTQFFAALGPRFALDGISGAVTYRFGFHPGSPATYLVRRIGTQSYVTGALDTFIEHQLAAELAVALYEPVTLELAGDWTRSEQPRVIESGAAYSFLPESYRDEAAASVGLRFGVAPGHELTLRYRHPFLEAWNEDPFFPVAIPERGLTLGWKVRSR